MPVAIVLHQLSLRSMLFFSDLVVAELVKSFVQFEMRGPKVVTTSATVRGKAALRINGVILAMIVLASAHLGGQEGWAEDVGTETNWTTYHGIDGRNTGYSPDAGPSQGRIAWRFPKGDHLTAKPVISDGRVYVSSPGSDVVGFCLDESTGEVIWRARQNIVHVLPFQRETETEKTTNCPVSVATRWESRQLLTPKPLQR
jgi:outer membrane protein assembly factor BamB